jgi:hypothetical protein
MSIHIPSRNNAYCQFKRCCDDPCGDRCPDHTIRRHDTLPAFKVNVEDCDGPLDIDGLVLEANMWAKAKLRKAIIPTDTAIQLSGDIGFEQVMIGDIIIMERVRQPEHLLVTDIDEDNRFLQVQRGYNGTKPGSWRKGSKMRMFRVLNSPAITEQRFNDQEQLDGTTDRDVLTDSFLVYEWKPQDTCLPGCYWLEFKLLKMKDRQFFLPGGKWTGMVNIDGQGNYFTGTMQTDSSVLVSTGIGDPMKLLQHIRDEVPSPLYFDPNFIEPITPNPEDHNYDLWRVIIHLYPNPVDVPLRWAIWDRLMHLYPNGIFYNIPKNVHWTGPVHVWDDGVTYTGSYHDDGSVYLDVNGVAIPQDATYNGEGMVSVLCDTCPSITSIIPSYTYPSIASITPSVISNIDSTFGCDLGAGVEWVRRFPNNDSEGFLIKIIDSYTGE